MLRRDSVFIVGGRQPTFLFILVRQSLSSPIFFIF